MAVSSTGIKRGRRGSTPEHGEPPDQRERRPATIAERILEVAETNSRHLELLTSKIQDMMGKLEELARGSKAEMVRIFNVYALVCAHCTSAALNSEMLKSCSAYALFCAELAPRHCRLALRALRNTFARMPAQNLGIG